MIGSELLAHASPTLNNACNNSIDDEKKGIFAEIPNEIIFDQILVYFEYRWILKTARLVCKLWNDHYKTIKTNQFTIKYRGNIENISLMLNEHSDELHQVTELITQHIHGHYISIFQEFISKLINLQNLQLMTRDCDISIIKELVRLQNLKKIDLPNFTHFREFTKSTSRIKSITISDPNATAIEVDFSDLSWLLEEFICNCSLTSKSIISLLKNEIMIKNLNKLKISYSEVDENVMKEISTISKLRELNLNSVKCRDDQAQYISKLENLESLILYNNSINGSGLSNFGNLTNITKLNLDYNSIDNEGANYLSSLTSLTDLHLRNNKISDEGLKNYSKLTNLSEINLSNNLIGSIGANYLSQISNITCLNLNNNLIDEEGLINFGNLSNLKMLHLENNQSGNGFQYLSNCKQIEYLNVYSNNNISEESVLKYCKMKPLVNYLNISNNPIGNSGFASLLQLPQLTSIEANNCGISDKGILEMLEIIQSKNEIISLDLEDNTITNNSLKKIIESKHIDKINRLDISNSKSELDSKYLDILSKKLHDFDCTQTKPEKKCTIQ